jgi:hypothetical protein
MICGDCDELGLLRNEIYLYRRDVYGIGKSDGQDRIELIHIKRLRILCTDLLNI